MPTLASYTAGWWLSLLAVIFLDLILAGDNASVIALSARHLPQQAQRHAVFWGTVAAVLMRVLMTIGALWLLQIPGMMLLGGLVLAYTAWRLLAAEGSHRLARDASAPATFFGTLRTIVVANALLGVDNVLAVAAAAQGDAVLVAAGLIISIPIVIWGSGWMLRLLTRWPALWYVGTGLLAGVAALMIANESWLIKDFFSTTSAWWYGGFVAAVVAVLLAAGHRSHRRAMRKAQNDTTP